LQVAADLFDGAVCHDNDLGVLVPSDGAVASLRRILGLLDDAGIEVEDLSIHAPNLDDVFFAVTGHPSEEVLALS
jgi:ABC-2 type transport system ATP-binding protein